MNEKINVCIMYPNEFTPSETFIRNQVEFLPEKVFPLYGAWFPFLQPGRKHILGTNPFARASRRFQRDLLQVPQKQLLRNGMVHFLKKNRIHVVLAQYALTGIAVMECCEEANVPLVVHFHGFDAFDHKTVSENHSAYRRMFESARKIISVSQHMREQIQNLGCPAEKICVSPCGVDTTFFAGGGSVQLPPQFVAVGRFSPVKGPQLTLKAFQLVLNEIPEAKLVMVGEGELLQECKELAKTLHIDRAVTFTGALSPEGVLEVLRHSRVFVQHGIYIHQGEVEGMGLSVMEASSTGLPIVATRHGGLKESVQEGETGFLVEEGDVVGMAAAMTKLAKDDALCLEMGKKGRQRMKEYFDLPKSIDCLDKILREAMERRL